MNNSSVAENFVGSWTKITFLLQVVWSNTKNPDAKFGSLCLVEENLFTRNQLGHSILIWESNLVSCAITPVLFVLCNCTLCCSLLAERHFSLKIFSRLKIFSSNRCSRQNWCDNNVCSVYPIWVWNYLFLNDILNQLKGNQRSWISTLVSFGWLRKWW